MKLTTAQIGKCGETLVQYELLRAGIESAQMTTDTGIDLVAYLPESKRAVTIQVKTVLAPKPGGGKGKLALDWWVRKNSPAEMVALVDLGSESIWLLSHEELGNVAQQQNTDRLHFYFYADEGIGKSGKAKRDYDHLLLAEVLSKLQSKDASVGGLANLTNERGSVADGLRTTSELK